ncbi:MAG TPA: FAD-dependent thymidylate synthase [Actinomycetota bacterium]|nr:FAD-dependent thymidylate synthase [Actinomycetota bacterium]
MTDDLIRPGDKPHELLLFDHGFVRLDDAMASDLSVVNSARVSFAVRREEMDDRDKGLIKFLMRERHGTPFEHNSFRFHVRTPIFVAREWFRHRVGCLTGDTVVTFTDVNGHAGSGLSKTMSELHAIWTVGERNGLGLTQQQERLVRRLAADGKSIRCVARSTGVGRRAVTRVLREGTTEWRDGRWRLGRMRLRTLNEETNEFGEGRILDVVDSGRQPVYLVTLADGKQLKATSTHQLLTSDGWRTLREAVGLVGDGAEVVTTRACSLMVNGAPVHTQREWLARKRADGASVATMAAEAGCSDSTIRKWLRKYELQFTPEERTFPAGHIPWNKGKKGYKLNRRWTQGQKDAVRRARSGSNSNFWRGGVSSDRASIARWTTEQAPKVHHQFDYTCQVQGCGRRGGKLHAHHIVPVWLDPSLAREIGNLISVCDACHRRIHRTQKAEIEYAALMAPKAGYAADDVEIPRRRGVRLAAHPVRVVSVEYFGVEQTYDLCVEGPWHNFVANGIVVHNSFNEESGRYHKLSDDFYVPAPEAVRTQVGKPGSYSFEPVDERLADETIDTFKRIYKDLFAEYEGLIEKGVAKELARSILPFGIYTQFYWTLNARSLMNFLSLRNATAAQYEIRVYADAVERLFAERMPITHECFVEFGRRAP